MGGQWVGWWVFGVGGKGLVVKYHPPPLPPPFLHQVIRYVSKVAQQWRSQGDHYFILLILTDGIITDMPQTTEVNYSLVFIVCLLLFLLFSIVSYCFFSIFYYCLFLFFNFIYLLLFIVFVFFFCLLLFFYCFYFFIIVYCFF